MRDSGSCAGGSTDDPLFYSLPFLRRTRLVVRIEVDSEMWTLAEAAASDLGFELLDVELAGSRSRRIVRAYIEKPGGVSLSDCAAVSRELGERLDGVIDDSYRLEVSSPGVERPLRRIRDFERCLGRRARIRLKDGRKANGKISGKIIGVDGNTVRVLSEDGKEASLSLADIAKANLAVDWEAEFQGRGDLR